MSYVELGLGHSRQINDRLRVGGKFKLLFGLGRADVKLEDMTADLSAADKWVVSGKATADVSVKGFKFESEMEDYNVESNGQYEQVSDFDVDGFGLGGFGIAFDLGAEYKIDEDWTVSAALLDLGFISWKENARAESSGQPFVFDGFHHIGAEDNPETGESALDQEMDQLEDDLKALARFKNEEDSRRTQSLTTTLNIGGEYSILNRKISFGLLSSTRMTSPKVWTELMASVNFRPASWFHATLNGSVSNLGQSVGVLLNFCPKGFNFFIGSDYIPLKYSKQGIPVSTAKLNFVMGLTFTFKHG